MAESPGYADYGRPRPPSLPRCEDCGGGVERPGYVHHRPDCPRLEDADTVRWWEWRKRRACPHPRLRCIHGDEINAVGGRRAQCLRCFRYLRSLPAMCSVTGELHPSACNDGRDDA